METFTTPSITQPEDNLLYVQKLLSENNQQAITELLIGLSHAEVALLLDSFPPEQKPLIWECVPEDYKGKVIASLGDQAKLQILGEMQLSEITEISQPLKPQELSEILSTVDEPAKNQIISGLEQDKKEQVVILQNYSENEVGHHMDPSMVSINRDVTLETVQRFIRMNGLLNKHSQELLVVDDQNHYIGAIRLVDLIKQPQNEKVSEFIHSPAAVLDSMNINDAAMILSSKELSFAPVVDQNNKLVGQLKYKDILEITVDSANSTLMNISKVSDDEELFAPITKSAKSRGVWLGINLATAFLAAFVIGQFEAVLSQIVALAVLMPIVASMGGIAGSQTLTVVIRGLATGQIGGSNRGWLINKETWVGAINGLVWAIVVGLMAQLWFGNLTISLILGFAIVINMTVANVSGIIIPLILKRLHIDPALSGSVILTTVTDVVGFMSFLGLATLLILET